MTRTERAFARRWRSIALACWLVAITGAVLLVWARIDAADHRGDQLAARGDQLATEAARRGNAVSTLATDVRQLRAQVKAAGRTPVAPDPGKAVKDLPDRAEVPVPIPGEKGDPGEPGKAGRDGKDGKPGPSGSPGSTGAVGSAGPAGQQGPQGEPGPAGPQGPQGPPGVDGKDGRDGADGRDGQTCPDGYSLQPPPDDPDALVCRRDGAPQPDEPTPGPTTPAVLAPDRRRS